MANATDTLINPNAPALQRIRALIALTLQLICTPSRADELARMCDEAEQLLARHLFDLLIRLTGRTDLRATHDLVLRHRGAKLAFALRRKPHTLHPYHRIIVHRRRETAIRRYRTAHGCRSRCSNKRSLLRANNQRRSARAVVASRRAACAPPLHTPAHINAPP